MRKSMIRVFMLVMALVMCITGSVLVSATALDPFASSNSETETVTPKSFIPSTKYSFEVFKKAIADFSYYNKDVKGWFYVPNTNMNHPVTFSNVNNNYYLYRDWRGNDYTGKIDWRNWSQYPDGATYLDYRTVIGDTWLTSSRNMVLYGHNWNNLRDPMVIGDVKGYSMFAQLPSYTSVEFASQNPHIYYSLGDNEGIWRVFAAGYCVTTPYFFYNNPNPTKEAMLATANDWKLRSHLTFDVDVNENDRFLTLTTCTRRYGSYETQRYVVVARLLRPGESENDPVTVTVNPNIKHPDFGQPTKLPAATDPTATPEVPIGNTAASATTAATAVPDDLPADAPGENETFAQFIVRQQARNAGTDS